MADDGGIRVGDEERRAVDARLQRAHGEGRLSLEEYEERAARAWAARTRGDLVGLTADLPPDGAVAHAPRTTELATGARAGDLAAEWARRAGSALGTVVLLGAVLWGGSHLLAGDDGTAVFSSRTIGVAENTDRVDVGVLFGSVTVVVPDDVRVNATGWKVFGSTECELACSVPGPREVTVDVSGAFGSTDILTRTQAATQPADDNDDD
ncbi:DUF1707 SHOCT-like domain-containing protein [Pseudonocardia parietis]|uniref:DUF1707 domain-containing protein n=1 Tax=Pseudonocardia parietis TaxID=570936 RepID=A0ABS4VPQ2_9PSEU|nr:DUF1707 domain-containing protein [Pseudonocardia parietis]MBP2365902.1 hypothetical protein [Pseudonocardia parietis]